MSTGYTIVIRPTLMGILNGEKDINLDIGHSSGGWCFALNILPWYGINNLRDWYNIMRVRRNIIKDEYGRVISWEDMIAVITKRSGNIHPGYDFRSLNRYKNGSLHSAETQWMRDNMAEYGPNGLIRARISTETNCVAHGAGTWDLFNSHQK